MDSSLSYKMHELHQFISMQEAQICELKLKGNEPIFLLCSVFRSSNCTLANNDRITERFRKISSW